MPTLAEISVLNWIKAMNSICATYIYRRENATLCGRHNRRECQRLYICPRGNKRRAWVVLYKVRLQHGSGNLMQDIELTMLTLERFALVTFLWCFLTLLSIRELYLILKSSVRQAHDNFSIYLLLASCSERMEPRCRHRRRRGHVVSPSQGRRRLRLLKAPRSRLISLPKCILCKYLRVVCGKAGEIQWLHACRTRFFASHYHVTDYVCT
jgi:hypothetical protein